MDRYLTRENAGLGLALFLGVPFAIAVIAFAWANLGDLIEASIVVAAIGLGAWAAWKFGASHLDRIDGRTVVLVALILGGLLFLPLWPVLLILFTVGLVRLTGRTVS